jgi:hypothetical protein
MSVWEEYTPLVQDNVDHYEEEYSKKPKGERDSDRGFVHKKRIALSEDSA